MQIDTYYPQHPRLKQLIAYYYFLHTDQPDFHIQFHVYPQLQIPVTIHRFASFDKRQDIGFVKADPTNPYLTLCNGLLKGPLEACIEGIQERLTIVFQPLGLNYFIGQPYHKIVGNDISVFTGWDGPAYTAFQDRLFENRNQPAQIALLEEFLMSRYKNIKNDLRLQQAVTMLSGPEAEQSVSQIAAALGLNERTFNRMFHKHFSVSPVQFKKIARFRHALELKMKAAKGSLTDVAYQSNYYDQSHLVASYRELTGRTPSDFFKGVQRVADKHVVMRVLD